MISLKKRFRETLLFGNPDKVPLSPGEPRESTLAAWHKQGLSEGLNWYQSLLDILGISEARQEIQKPIVDLAASFEMIPTFEEKVLKHKDGHYIVQDWMGAITEISDEYDCTYIRSPKDFVTRRWIKFPVEDRKDWREMKKRFRPETPGRYPEDLKTRSQILESQDYPIILNINGPFWQLREWCGMENLCMLMLDDSDWIEEMVNFWANFVSEVMAPIQKQVKIDCIVISEDMAYKTRSMISPKMVKQIFLPVYQRWVLQIKKGGCPIVSLDSDGYVAELIPLWIEAGINCSEPMEVAAGNDIVSYRRIYGKEMAYRGGIDKRAIAKGGQVMEEEVMRVVSPLLEGGGFIPSCDHGVPPDISWPNYVEYSRLLAKLTGWL